MSDEKLPDWLNVYEGLSDDEISEIEKIILDRSHFTNLEKQAEVEQILDETRRNTGYSINE